MQIRELLKLTNVWLILSTYATKCNGSLSTPQNSTRKFGANPIFCKNLFEIGQFELIDKDRVMWSYLQMEWKNTTR